MDPFGMVCIHSGSTEWVNDPGQAVWISKHIMAIADPSA